MVNEGMHYEVFALGMDVISVPVPDCAFLVTTQHSQLTIDNYICSHGRTKDQLSQRQDQDPVS